MRSRSTPMVEILENRTFLSVATSTTPPDLVASLHGHFATALAPGAKVQTVLHVTDQGGSLPLTSIPVDVYISDTGDLSSATEIVTPVVSARFNAGASRNFTIKFSVPSDLSLDSYYVIVQMDTTAAVQNNPVVSGLLTNPVGTYSGSFTLDGEDYPIDFTIDGLGNGSLISAVADDGSIGPDSLSLSIVHPQRWRQIPLGPEGAIDALDLSDMHSSVSANGRYHTSGAGSVDVSGYGRVGFGFSATGQISGDTISGTIGITVTLSTGQSQTVSSKFEVTKSS